MNKSIVTYWRHSLADEQLFQLMADAKEPYAVPTRQLKECAIDPELIKPIFEKEEKRIRLEMKLGEEFQLRKLDVVIAPYVLRLEEQHGEAFKKQRKPKTLYPLWIKAVLNRADGKLDLDEDRQRPWLNREILEPTTKDLPTLGDIQDSDEFYTLNDYEPEDFQTCFEYGTALLRHVTDKNDSRNIPHYKYHPTDGVFLVCSNRGGSAQSILTILDDLLDESKSPEQEAPLLRIFSQTNSRPPCKLLNTNEILDRIPFHLGQMNGQHGLTASQREALGHLLNADEEPVMVVNGPPGTGKTTLLHSVIASKWVQAALEEKRPPICLATSANNQAVTNIISSFESKRKDLDEWSQRWLPVDSFGLFLAAEDKVDWAISNGYHYRTKYRKTNLSIESDSILKLEEYFLEWAQKAYQHKFTSVMEVKKRLHQDLKKNHDSMREGIQLIRNYCDLHEKVEQDFGGFAQLTILREKLQAQTSQAKARFQSIQEGRAQWPKEYSTLSIFIKLIASFGIQTQAYLNFFEDYRSKVQGLISFQERRNAHVKNAWLKASQEQEKTLQELENQVIGIDLILNEERLILTTIKDWQDRHELPDFDPLQLKDFACSSAPHKLWDTVFRYRLFLLASHYWEARWLIEASDTPPKGFNHDKIRYEWSRRAMLTPLNVATFYSGPAFFMFPYGPDDFRYALNFIDLLIIDEAGQAPPALASGLLAMSKRALLVGDLHQIEPILPLPEHIDLGNAQRYGVVSNKDGFYSLSQKGMMASANSRQANGNLLRLAQQHTPYQESEEVDRGSWLKEHWRCAPTIIHFSNRLCYRGMLIPMREEKEFFLPRMGYAQIIGNEQRQGSSRSNPDEAQMIAAWLEKRRQEIEDQYGKPLKDLVGVITPFAAQAGQLKRVLEKLGINQVGTVHRFQGGEMPIILFSSVYSSPTGEYFFDRTPNMLNVAVSRAKDSFLVFGNLNLFDPHRPDRPSGFLAQSLFHLDTNEITDLPWSRIQQRKEWERLDSLAAHQAQLRNAILDAEKEVGIISPFLSYHALESDDLCNVIKQKKPKARVRVFYDAYLNKEVGNRIKPNAQKAIDMLQAAGAEVTPLENVHSKTLWVDDELIIEGSFNWLSAVRSESEFRRYEASLVGRNEIAKKGIANLRKYLQV